MKKSIRIVGKKVLATVTVCSLALGLAPIVKSEAAAKKPKLNSLGMILAPQTLEAGKLSVKKNGTVIKSVTWKSSNKKVATVTKKNKLTVFINTKNEGAAKITAIVKYKLTRKARKVKTVKLKCPVNVIIESVAGGWEIPEDPSVTPEQAEIFSKAIYGQVGVEIVPVAVLGEQVVAGMNYRVLCRLTMVTETASAPVYEILTIWSKVDGTAEITEYGHTNVPAILPEGEAALGAFVAPATPTITDERLAAYLKNNAFEIEGVDIKVIGLAGSQIVSGSVNYALICETTPVYPGAEAGYSIVYVNVADNGAVELGEIVPLEDNAEV